MKRIYLFAFIFSLSVLSACGTATTEKKPESNSSTKPTEVAKVENKNSTNGAVAEAKDDLVEIYDGRKYFYPKEFPESEAKPVQAEFDEQIELIKDKMGESFCNEVGAISIRGIANGSFTKPNSNQKAVFYYACHSDPTNKEVGGLIIFENGKAVSHFVYATYLLFKSLISSPDFNKNGLNQLIFISQNNYNGDDSTEIYIAEVENRNLKFFGSSFVSESSLAAKDNKGHYYRILVQPASNPIFYRDSYEIKGDKKEWKEVKKGEKLSLDKENSKMYDENFKSLEITQVN